MQTRMMQIAVVVGMTVATLAAQAKVLPEFMNTQQLTAWRGQHAAPAIAATQAPDEQNQFFTGKPYDAVSETFVFMFRNYRPSLARWTSADPSGFPDGANNMAYVANPTREIDLFGLKSCLWCYADADVYSIDDSTCASGLATAQGSLLNYMYKENAKPGVTHYDISNFAFGDYNHSTSTEILDTLKTYDKVFVIVHGDPQSGELMIGGNRYKSNALSAPNMTIFGCSTGVTIVGLGVRAFTDPTKNYLKITPQE